MKKKPIKESYNFMLVGNKVEILEVDRPDQEWLFGCILGEVVCDLENAEFLKMMMQSAIDSYKSATHIKKDIYDE